MKPLNNIIHYILIILLLVISWVLHEHRLLNTILLLIIGVYFVYLVYKLSKAQKELLDSQAITKNAFENTALGMCLVTPKLEYIAINKAYCDILGYSIEELMHMTPKDFAHPEDREIDTPFIKNLFEGKTESFSSVKRYIHKKGHVIWSNATVRLVKDEQGKPKFFVTQIQDITALKNAEQSLQNAASIDYLTDCLNRGAFIKRLNQEIERSKRENTSISLILTDIDFFKKINDNFGHLSGDNALKQISKCLSENCRVYDFIGRFGGEEFIIALPNTTQADAMIIAERMRSNIENLEIALAGVSPLKITSSFGVANFDSKNDNVDSFIQRADQALYKAKATRNLVCAS